MKLIPQSPSSYRCSDPIQLSVWLIEQGYRGEASRSPYEYMRLRRASSLIVVYDSGSVILQGGNLETPRDLFKGLIDAPAETSPLPF